MNLDDLMDCASMIVKNNKEYLLQLRDNNPAIPFPNTWGLFGGKIESHETPEEAVFREFKEETGIALDSFYFYKKAEFADGNEYLFYTLDYIPLQKIQLSEGQKAEYIAKNKLKKLNFCLHDGVNLVDFDINFAKIPNGIPLNRHSRVRALTFENKLPLENQKMGVQPLPQEAEPFFKSSHFFRRGIFIGQRGFEDVLKGMESGEKFDVVVGVAASGQFQLGGKLDVAMLNFFKSKGMPVHVWILDIDGYIDRERVHSPTEAKAFTKNYIKNIKKLGLSEEDIVIQSQKESDYFTDALCLSKEITLNTFSKTYGHYNAGFFFSSLLMYSMFFNYIKQKKKVLGIGGIEEDSHARILRDLLRKKNGTPDGISFLYFKHQDNLAIGNDRLSSSHPESTIFFDEPKSEISQKINAAFDCKEEITKCKIFEFYKYNEPNDQTLNKIFEDCVSNKQNCKNCKKMATQMILNIIKPKMVDL